MSQFHYGSIKTLKGVVLWKDTNGSQFHYGSIKTIHGSKTKIPSVVVSIPLWFD